MIDQLRLSKKLTKKHNFFLPFTGMPASIIFRKGIIFKLKIVRLHSLRPTQPDRKKTVFL